MRRSMTSPRVCVTAQERIQAVAVSPMSGDLEQSCLNARTGHVQSPGLQAKIRIGPRHIWAAKSWISSRSLAVTTWVMSRMR
jgi:hypothetical protein